MYTSGALSRALRVLRISPLTAPLRLYDLGSYLL